VKGGERKNKARKRRRGRGGRARVEHSSGGVVIRRNGDGLPLYLLIRDPYENWGLPKGHIEGEETAQAAAVREVGEETGLQEMVVLTELPTIDWYYRDRGRLVHKFCHFYLLESIVGEPVPQRDEGITACIWCTFQGALETLTYDNAREVLRAAGTHLGEN
jgi:8-oxo-dGTP pyrophosphatase MutT (NUDIX family)